MNASDLLLDQWQRQVKELFPHLHSYQQEALAFAVQGVVHSGNAVLQRVAEAAWEHWSSPTKMLSHERRLQRLVANERIDVQACWSTLMEHVLSFWHHKPVTLVLDLTPYTSEMTIVYVGIVVQARVLPVAWQVMPQHDSWEERQWPIVARLFEQAAAWLQGADCTLLADRGLSCLELIKLCEQVGWHYVLRIKQQEWMRRKFRHLYRDWQQGQQVIVKEGQQWYGRVRLWKEHEWEGWLSACWEKGNQEPWLLISDRRACHHRVKEYAKRMRVEAMFQDHKRRGCMLENSRFRNPDHLNRWLLVVFLAIWWMTHLGSSCMHHGQRGQLDRTDRRDKGLLRLGRLWLKAILKKADLALGPDTLNRVKAQLANCLPFSHRNQRLFFSIYLH